MAFVDFSHEIKTHRMKNVHVHPWHELYYLEKGSTRYLIGDEIYHVEEGNLVFIPKGHYHMTDNGDCEHVERSLLSFGDDLFDSDTQVILDSLMSQRLISIPIGRIEALDDLFAGIERSLSLDGAIGEATRKIHALSILSFVCRHKREIVPFVREADRIVHEVSGYISANYSEDLSLSSLSHRFSVSESHLSRKFKDVSGMGLNEYITLVRVMNAERLLREGTHTITEVATLSGFNDSNYFSTVFKRIKGTTPLRFAKTAAE